MAEQVGDYLQKLVAFKSTGPDGMHTTVILDCLEILFGNSWMLGGVLDEWKRANVVPISFFFKGERGFGELQTSH